MQLGKRSRSNSYDDIEYYHAIKKFKCHNGSSCSVWSFKTFHAFQNKAQAYAASIPANTFRCDATTDEGNLLTATSVSPGSYQ
jgi:hypothetical protein